MHNVAIKARGYKGLQLNAYNKQQLSSQLSNRELDIQHNVAVTITFVAC